MAQSVPIDPDKGIPDLVSQLASDSKRLLKNEVQLAKLETRESVGRASKGALWMVVAFAFVVVAVVAFTLFLATFIGRLVNGHYWVGALITGALELGLGFWLVKRGLRDFAKAPYSMPETRATLTLSRD
jgi:Putative Actinobacterial Holin-X, holin superfamily III